MTVTDYADGVAFLANTSAQSESLLHNLKQTAGCIGLHVNANKKIHVFYTKSHLHTKSSDGETPVL